MLADVNVQGHVPYLRRVLEILDLWSVLEALPIEFATFPTLGLRPDLDDRSLWRLCQDHGWVLFTENRRQDDANSLQSTLADSWQVGDLPVLTIANKRKFESSRSSAERVATDVAELLFGIHNNEYRDQPRIYVPRQA